MMKNMFGGELKSKKEQKNLEQILKTIVSTTKEKTKNEACLKLLDIFENTLDININFDYLLGSIDDLSDCNTAQCRRIWLQIAMQIIKFRSEYRPKLSNKMMKVASELSSEDNPLKIRTIHCASNCCMDIQGLDPAILIEFLTFECLMIEEYQKENVYVMILNLLKHEHEKISIFLIEFIIDCIALICLKKFSNLRELSDLTQIEEEKKNLKTIIQFFEFYLNNMKVKRNSIIKNIILIYCFFVNYEREFCWKQMKNFLIQDGKTIFKYFLEIIYCDTISSTFSTLENYFFYDSDEEFGLPSYFDKIYFFENYYKYFISRIGDCNNIFLKQRIKIINGSIFFIGMSLWGYERVESIQIPNTIIVSHFYKLASSSHRKIDQEMIQCLRRLIKKFGDSLTDEWTQIFQILQMILNREKSQLNLNANHNFNSNLHINDKNILEILDTIKMLVVSNKFYGSVTAFYNILDEFKNLQNESLIFMRSKFKLGNFCKFIANLESLIIENLINSKSERVKNHQIEMIRLNYCFIFHKNQLLSMKKSIIENLISKHFSSLIFSFETAENLNYFSHLITEMCVLSHDLKFFEKILRSIFLLHNDLKFYQNESEKSKLLLNFQKNTLINMYSKLTNSFQKEKIKLINKKIYSFLDAKNEKADISFLIVILNFFKNFIVNKDYELFLQEDKIYRSNMLPSQTVINYHYNTILLSKKNKKVYENLKSKKVNVYEPYIVFKHNKIYDYLIHLINQDETNTFVCEEVLDLLLINLKTTFFFKGLKLEKLLNTIISIDDIKKYSIRKKFIDLVIEILSNSTFHLHSGVNSQPSAGTGLSYHSSNGVNTQTIQNSNVYNQPSIEVTDDTLKERIINFLINSLKSFAGMLRNMITNYKKIVINYLNSRDSQSMKQDTTRQSQNIKEGNVGNLNNMNVNMNMNNMNTMANQNINLNTPGEFLVYNQNSNSSLASNQNQSLNSILNLNININNITENFIENNHLMNLNSQNSLNNVNLKMTVYYIKRIFNLIAIYFSSINIQGNSVISNIKNLSGFYGYNTNWINFNHFMVNPFSFNTKKFIESISSLIEIMTEMRNLCFYKLSISVAILNFILSIKDILINSGEEIIIKTIFLVMNIGYHSYEGEILKLFSENFQYKFKKFEVEKVKPADKFMKREYVNLLSDTCLLYFIENSQNGRILMNIFSIIFKNPSGTSPLNLSNVNTNPNINLSPNYNPQSLFRHEKSSLIIMRESLFLDLAKWQIHSKTNRDNIKSEYRNKISPYSQIYLGGKHSIIMIIPIDHKTFEVVIRNPIANINVTINSDINNSIEKDVNSQINVLNGLINNSEELDNLNRIGNGMENDFERILHRKSYISDNFEFDEEVDNSDRVLYKSDLVNVEQFDKNKEEIPEKDLPAFPERRQVSPKVSHSRQISNISLNTRTQSTRQNEIASSNFNLVKPASPKNIQPYSTTNDPKNDPKNLHTAHMINNSNIIFQQILNTVAEPDIKFQLLENNSQLESYIKSLDNTPVYYTFNCGIIYIPNKNNITEYEIFTYEGETSQRYIKFISGLGKILSILDNPQIYTGGLNKTGLNGKYTLYHQDSLFQMVYHVISLIKTDFSQLNTQDSDSLKLSKSNSGLDGKSNSLDYLSSLFNLRKKLIGNDYVNIVWLENPFQEFDSSKIISGAILVYIVVYPISDFHNLIKIKFNKRSKFSIVEKVSNYFTEELCIDGDGASLSNYLIKLVILLNLMINYTLQKTAFKNVELERNNSNFANSTQSGNRYVNLNSQIHLDSNLTQRFKEIERINYRFKNSI